MSWLLYSFITNFDRKNDTYRNPCSANSLEEIPSGSAVLEGVERHPSVLRVTLNRCGLDEGTVGYGGSLIGWGVR